MQTNQFTMNSNITVLAEFKRFNCRMQLRCIVNGLGNHCFCIHIVNAKKDYRTLSITYNLANYLHNKYNPIQ
jgi:hypothetical protein